MVKRNSGSEDSGAIRIVSRSCLAVAGKGDHVLRRAVRGASGALCAVLLALGAAPAGAVDLSEGQVRGSLDTTVSIGAAVRTSDRDPDQLGGREFNVDETNYDDGNFNYKKGDFVSSNAKVTHELQLQRDNVGLFARLFYFYDTTVSDGSTERTPISAESKDTAGRDVRLLDAYVSGEFDASGVPVSVRLGNQVINWGESVFIRNGLNSINPLDVAKLRVAGAELRDGFLPVPAVDAVVGLTDNLSVEAFYQFAWVGTEIEGSGTFFSTNDFASPGSRDVRLSSLVADDTPAPGADPCNSHFQGLRGLTLNQAVALRMAPGLIAQGQTSLAPLLGRVAAGDATALQELVGALDAIATASTDVRDARTATTGALTPAWLLSPVCAHVPRGSDDDPSDRGQFGFAVRYFSPELNDTEFGFHFARIHSRLPLVSGHTGTAESVQVVADADGVRFLGNHAASARYIVEYPEDIDVYGISFNTELGTTGVALQGEASYRADQPLQIDDVELITHAMSALANHPVIRAIPAQPGRPSLSQLYATVFDNQLGVGELDSYFAGYRRKDVVQAQVAATKLFGPSLGADSTAVLGEVGVTRVLGMEEKSVLRYEGEGWADPTSWGYRVVAQATYNNAIGPVSLVPRIAFSHDVKGTAPQPIGNFIEDRKTVTLSLQANYLESWSGRLSYTNSFGAGRLVDRDFVALSVNHSF